MLTLWRDQPLKNWWKGLNFCCRKPPNMYVLTQLSSKTADIEPVSSVRFVFVCCRITWISALVAAVRRLFLQTCRGHNGWVLWAAQQPPQLNPCYRQQMKFFWNIRAYKWHHVLCFASKSFSQLIWPKSLNLHLNMTLWHLRASPKIPCWLNATPLALSSIIFQITQDTACPAI